MMKMTKMMKMLAMMRMTLMSFVVQVIRAACVHATLLSQEGKCLSPRRHGLQKQPSPLLRD